MAADCLSIEHDDSRGLTVTGGLPYYGQSGTLSAIVAMLEMLRKPENHGHFGLVSGNGGLGQKHAVGIYSKTPPTKPFQEASKAETQGLVDAIPAPSFTETPRGQAEIITYSI